MERTKKKNTAHAATTSKKKTPLPLPADPRDRLAECMEYLDAIIEEFAEAPGASMEAVVSRVIAATLMRIGEITIDRVNHDDADGLLAILTPGLAAINKAAGTTTRPAAATVVLS
jgi:hypothetical protein